MPSFQTGSAAAGEVKKVAPTAVGGANPVQPVAPVDAMRSTMQPRAAPLESGSTRSTMPIGSTPSLETGGVAATTGDAPVSTTNKDAKKNAKVKDFYSSLLNKKARKSTAPGLAPTTPSATASTESTPTE